MPKSAAGRREALASRNGDVRVWDPVVRLFHWGLVACCVINLFLLPPGKSVHRYVGYAAMALIALRFVWGFVGTRHARFADFVRGPSAVASYLFAFAAGRAERHVGHNPAAGWVMILLMVLLAAVGTSGWLTTLDAFWGNKALGETHELLANSLMIVAGLHASAAVVESWHLKENLIWSMVTGRKKG
ncbi:cytochrome b [Sinorhizobium fredii]|uniref:Cytochrome B n=3 Tax=Sinorhizobium TaxID=28105 RepID=A0A844A4B7_RHIFR|nr:MULTISPECIES: cytochrome b/b6 domain-containing protein [Sinorhizobium]AFL55331.1 putative cytochrome B561 protein [Sinorhizobium fredii USDA 257]MQW98618.1 cytochrome B [Sinorhizobium fredii]MQX06988.1 cytochrome B [Sinorhizobium fredii]OAP46340.1 cytochrome B [Sinorhizobium glycinis]UTY47537.1 cytochrome B [Sinorhizobium fredii]